VADKSGDIGLETHETQTMRPLKGLHTSSRSSQTGNRGKKAYDVPIQHRTIKEWRKEKKAQWMLFIYV
jgi:hypothetical protein